MVQDRIPQTPSEARVFLIHVEHYVVRKVRGGLCTNYPESIKRSIAQDDPSVQIVSKAINQLPRRTA